MLKNFTALMIVLLVACIHNASAQGTTDAAATGISRAFNPAISINGLLSGSASDNTDEIWTSPDLTSGLQLQEISVDFSANVDVYLSSRATFSTEGEDGLGLEEIYLTTLQMPVPVTLRGGKMLNTFGRHNLYHLHHMAFTEPPLILKEIFGPDLNEVSLEASYLMPVSWYMDVTFGLLNGDNTNLFQGTDQFDFGYLWHLDNLWDVTDAVTLRFGSSLLRGGRGDHTGENAPPASLLPGDEVHSSVWGVDVQLKWRPLRYGRYRSCTIQGEYINTTLNIAGHTTDPLHGYFIQVLRKFQLRWWLQGRYGWFRRPAELSPYFPEPEQLSYDVSTGLTGYRYSAAIAYVPTEFSAFRLQYNYTRFADYSAHRVTFQVNVTIGSHPAHKY
ncbi:MAG TPA: hypothetical protein VKA68_07390 [bacterium]|nr:hypothetical protein [bacterium]